MFRKPSEFEDTSITSDGDKQENSLEPPTGIFRSNPPVLDPLQQFFHHYTSYIEKECKEKAAKALNLPEDDPKVVLLGDRLYKQAEEDLKKNGVDPGEFAGDAGAKLRDSYRKHFGMALTKAAVNSLSINGDAYRANSPILPFPQKSISLSGQHLLLGTSQRSTALQLSTYDRDYQEICFLGEGGFAKVYRARNRLEDQEYAIKKIDITPSRLKKLHKEERLWSLIQEVRTFATLSHPNIVRYYHSWMETLGSKPFRGFLEDKDYNGDSYYTNDSSADHEFDALSIDRLTINEPPFSISRDLSFEDGGVIFGESSKSLADTERLNLGNPSTGTATSSHRASVQDGDHSEETNYEDVDGIVKREFPPQTTSAELNVNGVTIFIKMSLHQMTLATYLSDCNQTPTHCFHTVPAAKMCLAILGGVEYLHDQNIVHRDLKPANILLTVEHGKPRSFAGSIDIGRCIQCNISSESRQTVYITPCVSDFGLVAKLNNAGVINSHEKSPVGTKLYRPAKMPSTEPIICPKLDVYSLGIIAFELVSKFATESERRKVLTDLSHNIYPDGFEKHEMAEGIKNMLCEERDHRWGTQQVRSWLEGFLVERDLERNDAPMAPVNESGVDQ